VLLHADSYVASQFSRDWIESLISSDLHAARSFRILYGLLLLETWHRRFIRERDYTRPGREPVHEHALVH
jgi:hypothetical protein